MSNDETLSEWKVTTVKDEPVDDAKLLGLGPTVETLSRFLTPNTLTSPLVIAFQNN